MTQIHVATWTMCVGGGEADDQKEVKKSQLGYFAKIRILQGRLLPLKFSNLEINCLIKSENVYD